MNKKRIVFGLLSFFLPIFLVFGGLLFFLLLLTSTSDTSKNDCIQPSINNPTDATDTPKSIEQFVKSHKDAYLLSWKAGGFLPSASISQTMVENGFNFTNPSGTSFWQAHNMGGVKTSKKEDFPVTLATFGQDSVDISGTKPGSNVGDGTGGAYTWFKDYNAGIVGKAEFMAHQTLYTGAINNTDGLSTLSAIYSGGWATDPTYLMKLQATYNSLGKQFQWLDQEAIQKYGNAPFKKSELVPNIPGKSPITNEKSGKNSDCVVTSDTSDQVTGQNTAPSLEVPSAYKGKLTLPPIDSNDYAGNNYPFGECTWYAYNRMAQIGKPIEWFSGDGGNGAGWANSARAKGYTVVKGKPSVGWAASMQGGIGGSAPPYGHVAVVEYVNSDGSILVSEANVINQGSGTRSWRVLDRATVEQIDFIQGKGA
ncbi:CHAP domain-containing protein [Enterococcus faecalis]|uniref:CHAP domain-containing protein n=1 Tax=Enterococcus faecalis TaxID=1351 RepID=UPI001A0204B7|nr:CHAP domain-containing protein [Enterococcus faecalis]EGO9471081.1 amidase [Enterococcus faecalis]EHK9439294.1 CHAP domain-containing protein [Enterococcus faecalis]EHR4829885.1 CHAP domain-containing protein [Enterococcus faecalis]EIP8072063.1 CHAP domain-containing protein [Enterococcus faecalis]EKO5931960.1 CHAP domain-containing protein [Enterococcus faecalis]